MKQGLFQRHERPTNCFPHSTGVGLQDVAHERKEWRVRNRVLAWFDFELNTTVLAEADKQKSAPIHCTLHHYQCCITYLQSVSFEMMQLLNYQLKLQSNFLINCIFRMQLNLFHNG